MNYVQEGKEEIYKKIFEFLPDSVLIYNDKKIKYINEAAEKLLGIKDKKELINKDVLNVVHEDYKDIVKERMKSLVNKDVYSYMGQILVSYNGNIVYVDLSATIVEYKGKESVLVIARDITERKKEEKSRHLLQKTIECEKLKMEFFSSVSHELKTPLNVILGTIQLLQIYSDKGMINNGGKNINKYINIAKQNSYRLLRLVNNIIDINRMDAGFYKIQLQNYDIVKVVEDITLSVAEYIKNKGIYLEFDTNIEEKVMAIDPYKIERIMLNLLSNSIKFTDFKGKISVSIYDNKDKVTISVKDTGTGIPKDKLRTIFERFKQVEKTLSRNKEGSGIGLSLVKYLVELHNGEIYVESEYGKGSEFIINIPVILLEEENIKENYSTVQEGNVERINIEFSDIYT
ncbi:PAS domain-containing sensor histidine kinase [Tepidibacter formicigenes]|uniref:histidine kinase n=1 Tax=Tepidibacter formicigenes DSM 15518 TaxID=1123349 RepID=A0A1M6NRR8_9FIRM|nr:PAS domain-containing sensor histidine kinase [Tepidibacter formicigenes]SHJ98338.1 PAS domain S-box-containing protein [Tepidibacter formicigenes DSM 15518]